MFSNPVLDHFPFVDQTVVRLVSILGRPLLSAQTVVLYEQRVFYGQVEVGLGQRQFQCGGIVFAAEALHLIGHVLADVREALGTVEHRVLDQSKFVVVDDLFMVEEQEREKKRDQ